MYVEKTVVPEEPIIEVKAEPEPVYIDEVSAEWSLGDSATPYY